MSDSAGVSPCMKSSADCTTRCSCCMSETMSWNPKGCCDADHANPSNTVATKLNDRKWTQSQWHNNRAACESAGYKWYMVSHADKLNLGNNSFVCAHTQFSRVNQLGNSRDDSIASQSANASLVGKLADRDETCRASMRTGSCGLLREPQHRLRHELAAEHSGCRLFLFHDQCVQKLCAQNSLQHINS